MQGSGTLNDPFIISTVSEFKNDLYDACVGANKPFWNYEVVYVRQVADLDFNGTDTGQWKSSSINLFDWDGQNHSMYNIVIDDILPCGVFGVAAYYCHFKNLRISAQITGRDNLGSIAGYFIVKVPGMPPSPEVVLDNVAFNGSIIGSSEDSNPVRVGSFFGQILNNTSGPPMVPIHFRNVASGGVLRSTTPDNVVLGGFVGYTYGDLDMIKIRIENCYSANSYLGSPIIRAGFVGFPNQSIEYVGNPSYFNSAFASFDNGFNESMGGSSTPARTLSQLRLQSTYSGWDFQTRWRIWESSVISNYPWFQGFTPPSQQVVADPPPGNYPENDTFNVTLTNGLNGRVYYETDGSAPNFDSPYVLSGENISVTVPMVVRTLSEQIYSKAVSQELAYEPFDAVAIPEFTPNGGAFPDGTLNVVIECPEPTATIRYTTDGSEPTTASPVIASGSSVPVLIESGVPKTLKAKAWAPGLSPSVTKTGIYTSAVEAATPVVVPVSGNYNVDVPLLVTASTTTPDATLRYEITDHGVPATPTAASPILPDGGVSVPLTGLGRRVSVRAFRADLNPSSVGFAQYRGRVSNPVLSPNQGSAVPPASIPVTITCETPDSLLRYVIGSGADPSPTNGTPIANGGVVNVPVPNQLRVIAYKADHINSSITSGLYRDERSTHRPPYVRFLRQIQTEPKALLATPAAAEDSRDQLLSANWVISSERESTIPPRDPSINRLEGQWDAFNHIGAYSQGTQKVFAGMVAYRFLIPSAAVNAETPITEVKIPAFVDRWLVDGLRLSIVLTDTLAPSTDIDEIRNGDYTTGPVLEMHYDPLRVSETNPEGAVLVDKAETITVTFPSPIPAKRYMFIYVSLENYLRTRGFWIEGAGAIRGQGVEVEFTEGVVADLPDYYFRYVTAPRQFLTSLTSMSTTVNDMTTASYTSLLPETGYDYAMIVNNFKATVLSGENPVLSSTGQADATAGVFVNFIKSQDQLQVVSKGRVLQGASIRSGSARRLIFRNSIPPFPPYLNIRLNVYFAPCSGFDFPAQGSTFMFQAVRHYAQYAYGSGSTGGVSSLLSIDLDPGGYDAFHEFTPKNVTIPSGIVAYYVVPHVVNFLYSPPYDGVADLLNQGLQYMGVDVLYIETE